MLFRQKRYGFNNELIEVYKFRSMYVESATPTRVRSWSPRTTRASPASAASSARPSIDELPQLFNVAQRQRSRWSARGRMRRDAKARDRLYDEVVDGYFARHRVKPGITGWAQINGWRGETDTDEKIQQRVEHDLYYIENWSLLLDLYILAATPFALLKSENAY